MGDRDWVFFPDGTAKRCLYKAASPPPGDGSSVGKEEGQKSPPLGGGQKAEAGPVGLDVGEIGPGLAPSDFRKEAPKARLPEGEPGIGEPFDLPFQPVDGSPLPDRLRHDRPGDPEDRLSLPRR